MVSFKDVLLATLILISVVVGVNLLAAIPLTAANGHAIGSGKALLNAAPAVSVLILNALVLYRRRT
jgi:hypothetical protein